MFFDGKTITLVIGVLFAVVALASIIQRKLADRTSMIRELRGLLVDGQITLAGLEYSPSLLDQSVIVSWSMRGVDYKTGKPWQYGNKGTSGDAIITGNPPLAITDFYFRVQRMWGRPESLIRRTVRDFMYDPDPSVKLNLHGLHRGTASVRPGVWLTSNERFPY